MSNTIEELRDYIRNEVGFPDEVAADIDLLDAKILDSFSVVEVASYIQSHFSVELQGDDLVRENFNTLDNMVSLIHRRSS